MSSNNREVLEGWIAERLSTAEESGGLAMLCALHVDSLGRETEVHSVRVGSKTWAEGAAALAAMLDSCASRYCAGLPGVQQLKLLALYPGEKKARFVLPLLRTGALSFSGGGIAGGSALSTEAATPGGSMALTMRHDELVMSQIAPMFGVQNGIISELRAAERQRSEEVRELFIALISELRQSVMLQHEHRMAELKFKEAWETRRWGRRLLPAAVNAAAGKEIFAQSAEYESLFNGMFDSLSGEDIRALATTMQEQSPELGALFMSAFAKHQRKKELEAEEMARVVRSPIGIDPEDDAAGLATARLIDKRKNGDDPQPPPENRHAGGSTNGTVANEAPANGPNGATKLDDDAVEDAAFAAALFDEVSEGEIATLTTMMRFKGKGALADRLRERFEVRKAKGTKP